MTDTNLKRFIPTDAKIIRSVADGKAKTYRIWFTVDSAVQSLTFVKNLGHWSLKAN